MTNNGEYTNEPRARLCHLRRWPNFVGYGFNLHSEKSKQGQYIGKIDADSPAESAGLRENDRIIEVNFAPIGNENHKQVVTRIKEGVTRNNTKYPEEVILLVLDPTADAYYKNKSIVVKSSDSNVEKIEAENRDEIENRNDSPRSSNGSVGKRDSSPIPQHRSANNEPNREYKHVTDFTGPTVTQTTKTNGSPAISRTSDRDSDHDNYRQSSPPSTDKDKRREFSSSGIASNINSSPKSPAKTSYPTPAVTSPSQPSSANGSEGALEFKMSAAEYREKLKAKQASKRDPRQIQNMSMKEKHDFIDRL